MSATTLNPDSAPSSEAPRAWLPVLPLLLAVALALDLALVLLLLESASDAFYQENNLVEYTQQGVLLLAIAGFAWRRRQVRPRFERRVFGALCLVSLAVFHRESDLQALLDPHAPLRAAPPCCHAHADCVLTECREHRAESKSGEGAAFFFTLPAREAQAGCPTGPHPRCALTTVTVEILPGKRYAFLKCTRARHSWPLLR
jgi:hypothetical protein